MYGHYLAMIKDVDWVGELLTDKTGKLWDDPAILQMAEDFQELREKGYFAKSVGSNVFPAAQNGEFAMGTAAMYYNGPGFPMKWRRLQVMISSGAPCSSPLRKAQNIRTRLIPQAASSTV